MGPRGRTFVKMCSVNSREPHDGSQVINGRE